MKPLKNLFLATVLCLGSISMLQAQSKIAHIDLQELIAAMPEFKAAQTELTALKETYQKNIQSSITEFQTLKNKYQSEAKTKTDEENQKRIVELQEKQQRIQTYGDDAQKKLAEKQAELLKPIQEKAVAAIDKVAKNQGFQYVIDRSTLIVADGKDLLEDVKKAMNIK